MSDEITDNPFEDDGADEFAAPGEYDEETAKAQGKQINEDLAESGLIVPNPAGGVADIPEDRVERAQAAADGATDANAVPPGESGQFGASMGMRQLKNGRVSVDGDELSDLFARMARLEQGPAPAREQTMEPTIGAPLRFYLLNHYGGKYSARAFGNLGVLRGFTQTAPGESRIFAFEKWPPEGDTIELVEINALGKRVARGG